jgi:hypothetical protein
MLLLACLVIATTACLHKPKLAAINNAINASTLPLSDTVYNSYSKKDRLNDSLQSVHERDSFFAIKPLARFYSNKKGEAFNKLIASMIDTTGVTKTPLHFTDTTLYGFNRKDNSTSSYQACRSKGFVIEVFSSDASPYHPNRLFINGHECRPGIELDTSLSGTDYANNIAINADDCMMMKFGAKEYLHISASIYNCNGNGCGVRYYILYDPLARKGMVLEQYRTGFITGYDKTTNAPVFINMYENLEDRPPFGGIMFSGRVYRLNRFNRIQRKLDRKGKQFYFRAYAKNHDDSLAIFEGNLPL